MNYRELPGSSFSGFSSGASEERGSFWGAGSFPISAKGLGLPDGWGETSRLKSRKMTKALSLKMLSSSSKERSSKRVVRNSRPEAALPSLSALSVPKRTLFSPLFDKKVLYKKKTKTAIATARMTFLYLEKKFFIGNFGLLLEPFYFI